MFGFLSKLFKNEIVFYKELANINDIVRIPSKREYIDNQFKKRELKKYIDVYKHILAENRTYVSKDLDFDNLKTRLFMNLELLKKTLFDNSSNDFASMEEKSAFKLLIQYGKMKIYWSNILDLERSILLRIYALEELLMNIIIFTSNSKRNAIKNELTNLHYAYHNLDVQKSIIINKMEACRIEVKLISTLTEQDCNLRDNILDEVKGIAEVTMPSRLKELDKSCESELALISILECEFEIYAYQNSEETLKLKEELFTLHKSIDELTLKQSIDEIDRLEKRYKLFTKYSNIEIDEYIIKILYSTKFKILSKKINNEIITPFLPYDDGTKYYIEIIMKKMERILLGKNLYFNYYFINLKKAIKFFSKFLKDDNGTYNYYNILCDNAKLRLILAFDSPYMLNLYFETTMVSASDYKDYLSKFDGYVKFSRHIPLKTLMWIMTVQNVRDNPLKNLYSIVDEYPKYFGTYKILEGIEKLSLTKEGVYYTDNSDVGALYESIRNNSNYQSVILPSTLKSIDYGLFNNLQLKSLELNEGLERLHTLHSLRHCGQNLIIDVSRFSIPSTLDDSSLIEVLNMISNYRKTEIVLTNYKNNAFINNESIFKEFITRVYRKKLINYNSVVVGEKVTKKEMWKCLYYSEFLSHLTLYDEDTQQVKLDTNISIAGIKNDIDQKDGDVYSGNLDESDIDIIYDYLRDKIYEKTGYNIKENIKKL